MAPSGRGLADSRKKSLGAGRFLSGHPSQTGRVKFNSFWQLCDADDGELLAWFGGAKLVKHLDGTCEILGGSAEDRGEARDWVTLFLQHVILREPRRVRVTALAQPDWSGPRHAGQRRLVA